MECCCCTGIPHNQKSLTTCEIRSCLCGNAELRIAKCSVGKQRAKKSLTLNSGKKSSVTITDHYYSRSAWVSGKKRTRKRWFTASQVAPQETKKNDRTSHLVWLLSCDWSEQLPNGKKWQFWKATLRSYFLFVLKITECHALVTIQKVCSAAMLFNFTTLWRKLKIKIKVMFWIAGPRCSTFTAGYDVTVNSTWRMLESYHTNFRTDTTVLLNSFVCHVNKRVAIFKMAETTS